MSENLDNNLENNFDEREFLVETPPVMPLHKKAIKIFTSPYQVVDNLMDHPKMLSALVLVSILTIVSGIINIPFTKVITENMMALYQQYGVPGQYGEVDTNSLLMGTFFAPIGIIIFWALYSVFFWLVGKIFKIKVPLKNVMSIYAHASIIQGGLGIIAAIMNSYIIKSSVDVFSFAILYPAGNITSVLFNFLTMFTLPVVWTLIVTGLGLSRMSDKKPINGILSVLIVYSLFAILFAFMTVLPFNMNSLLGGM